ncbi:YciI family protein [Clostridium sp.]|uniref:YciI family protein n=1 Tax=Clostridium sp. TaxID=1506 RepID=UPI002FC5C4F0
MLRNSKKEFIYVLKLAERLTNGDNWTQKDNVIVEQHFKYLKKLLNEGDLVLAGNTEGLSKDTFGLVIIKAYTEEKAKRIMENDPVVKENIMKSELYPYKIDMKSF